MKRLALTLIISVAGFAAIVAFGASNARFEEASIGSLDPQGKADF